MIAQIPCKSLAMVTNDECNIQFGINIQNMYTPMYVPNGEVSDHEYNLEPKAAIQVSYYSNSTLSAI